MTRVNWIAPSLGLALVVMGCGGDGDPDVGPPPACDGGLCADADTGPGPDGDADTGPGPVTCPAGTSIVAGWVASPGGAPGHDGVGGDGDYAVENGVFRAVFADPAHRGITGSSGGVLVDWHAIGAEDDHVAELVQLAGPSNRMQIQYDELVEETSTAELIVLRATGHFDPNPRGNDGGSRIGGFDETLATVSTTYEIRCGDPRIRVSTELTNTGSETLLYNPSSPLPIAIVDLFFYGGGGMTGFCPMEGQGTSCTPWDPDDPASIVLAPYHASTGSIVGSPMTFASYVIEGDATRPRAVGGHDDDFSAVGSFRFPPAGTDYPVEPGATRHLDRVWVFGGEADAASAVDVVLEDLDALGRIDGGVGTVTGRVPTEGLASDRYQRPLVVLSTTVEGVTTPWTMARVRDDGTFEAVLPAGDVSWELHAPGADPLGGAGGALAAGATLDLGELATAEMATLSFLVEETGGGGLPARILVYRPDGTPVDLGPRGGGSPAENVLLTRGVEPESLSLPVGTYEVFVTHGPWYSVVHRSVTLDATGDDLTFTLEPLDVIPDGFHSADFHVHSGASFDSSLPIEDRLLDYVAAGVDVVVSTEHDVLFDYGPTLAALAPELPTRFRDALRTVVGVEATTFVPWPGATRTLGHHNAFPLEVQAGEFEGGMIDDEELSLGELYAALRGMPAPVTPLVQLNHSRSGFMEQVRYGYFDACRLDPTDSLDGHVCFDSLPADGTGGWDLMEVGNGANAVHFVERLRDWHATLRYAPKGVLPVATANSDSHRLGRGAGYPVTLVRSDEPLASFDEAKLVEAVGSGAVAGSLGVFVWMEVRESGGTAGVEPGRDAPLEATSLEAHVTVAAAPWVPVEELRLRLGGTIVARLTVTDGDLTAPADPFGTDGVVRYDGVVDLSGVSLDGDTYLTAEAGFFLREYADVNGDGVLDVTDNDGNGLDAADSATPPSFGEAPMPFAAIVPSALPYGFTNPVYVDVDGDGVYTPPGTPFAD